MMNLRPSICLVSQYTLLAFGTCPKERDRERERERGRERERTAGKKEFKHAQHSGQEGRRRAERN